MAISWVQGYLERRRERRYGNRRVLDERFGDLSITAPMPGGWNQLPINPVALKDEGPIGHDVSRKHGRLIFWPSCCPLGRWRKKRKNRSSTIHSLHHTQNPSASPNPQISRSPTEREVNTPATSARVSDGPTFVYKPASDEFFKKMAEIGKPSPQTTPNLSPSLDGVENHKRRPSTLSSNGSLIDPPSPDFPRHPSYHHEPLNPSIDPLIRCKTPFSAISTPIDRTPYMSSPALSSLRTPSTAVNSSSGASFFSESEKTPIHVEKIHDVPVRPVSVAKPKRNQKGQKSQKKMREVTQELVPSDDELFG